MEIQSLSIRKDDRIHITLEGTAFLKYIIHRAIRCTNSGRSVLSEAHGRMEKSYAA